jgi:hypothetical protein
MMYWRMLGIETQYSTTPLLQHSSSCFYERTPFCRRVCCKGILSFEQVQGSPLRGDLPVCLAEVHLMPLAFTIAKAFS